MAAQTEPICILDNDRSVRRSFEQLLDSDGLTAKSFQDEEDFLAYARSHTVAVAVLDMRIPGTSGLEVQARLNEISPHTKVIIASGSQTAAIRAAAMQGGAFAFVSKPFDDEVFLSLVRRALRAAA